MRLHRGLFLLALCVGPVAAAAEKPVLVSPDSSRFRVNGYVETQVRALSDGFQASRAYGSQWAFVLDLEPEWDIAPNGWGPFDLVSAFARIEVRYDCIWTGCAVSNSWRDFGDRATRAPARNWADGTTERFVGGIDVASLGQPKQRIHGSGLRLRDISFTPRFQHAFDAGVPRESLLDALGPLGDDLFTFKSIQGPRETLAVPLGPWRPKSKIVANGVLADDASPVLPLPLRPRSSSLFVPSAKLREKLKSFDSFDQNFRQRDLEWNHGASQDEYELKELYLDLEMFDSRLWIRVGKQNIVWGKTELFRTTDQFNPVDIGLASLPSLEEARIALWSIRGVWSFWDVGPFQDVRLEVAANFDDFEPVDTGRCGEPYTVWAICFKSTGLWNHGVTGGTLAGESKPPDPWSNIRGVEVGARLEFRWDRFSVALMDFYGYDDVPSIEQFNTFDRRVDVESGAPLDSRGRRLTPANALEYGSANRQAFDFGCKASQGFGENALLALTGGAGRIPDISERCLGDLFNLQDTLTLEASLFGVPLTLEAAPTNVIGALLAGQFGGNLLVEGAINGLDAALVAFISGQLPTRLAPLNVDPNDGPKGGGLFGSDCPSLSPLPLLCGVFDTSNVSMYLTNQQEALIGCGPLYGTDCDVDGLDIFHTEASVLLQAFPGFEHNPVATRFGGSTLRMLPGSRGPGDPGYDPRVDGTPPAGFRSEMQALSSNFLTTLAILGQAEGDTACRPKRPETCAAVRAVIALTGSQRPEISAGGNGTYGRRDWLWHGGGEGRIVYPRRNVFGMSVDFAEDWTKTSWGIEFTWITPTSYASNASRSLLQDADTFNLTVSIDRPTFVNFLNHNRTFFLNTQVFFRYVSGHDSSFDTAGPLSVLATFAIATGYFQDRLLPSLVFVHDFATPSGGVVSQITYRMTEAFSVTVGLLAFYGGPGVNRVPTHPLLLFDTQTQFDARTRYEGLSAISERDELFLRLRYTF